MTTPSLTITYQGPEALDDPYWVRLEQDTFIDDSATVSDAAKLLDALYQIDPCTDSESDDSGLTTLTDATGAPQISVAEVASEVLDLSYCDQDPDGSVEVGIRVISSHPDEPTTLRVRGGEVLETVIVEQPVIRYGEISETLTLDYPVIGSFSCVPAPESRSGNTLRFASDQVGRRYKAIYRSRWQVATIKVYGVDGFPGDCRVLAFHHGLVDSLDVETPEIDEPDYSLCPGDANIHGEFVNEYEVTCYKDILVSVKCKCSDQEVDSYMYQQVVPCPDRAIKCPGALTKCMHLLGSEAVTKRVDCSTDSLAEGTNITNEVSDPDYYERMCCDAPSFTLPRCPERHTTYTGNLDIQYGKPFWRDIHGANARFIPVPPPGGICGEWIIRQQISSNNCCDGVDPLVWDTSVSPETMTPNSSVIIGVTGGGKYPYIWEVSGYGFQFQNGSTKMITTGNQVRISALPIACGSARITVTDGCTTVVTDIRCTAGQWVARGDLFHPQTLVDLDALGIYLCSSYGYPASPYNSVLQGRWWVGPYGSAPPDIVPLVYSRESSYLGLFASDANHSPVMVQIQGTHNEVSICALWNDGSSGACNSPDIGSVSGVYLYWNAPYMRAWEWVC